MKKLFFLLPFCFSTSILIAQHSLFDASLNNVALVGIKNTPTLNLNSHFTIDTNNINNRESINFQYPFFEKNIAISGGFSFGIRKNYQNSNLSRKTKGRNGFIGCSTALINEEGRHLRMGFKTSFASNKVYYKSDSIAIALGYSDSIVSSIFLSNYFGWNYNSKNWSLGYQFSEHKNKIEGANPYRQTHNLSYQHRFKIIDIASILTHFHFMGIYSFNGNFSWDLDFQPFIVIKDRFFINFFHLRYYRYISFTDDNGLYLNRIELLYKPKSEKIKFGLNLVLPKDYGYYISYKHRISLKIAYNFTKTDKWQPNNNLFF